MAIKRLFKFYTFRDGNITHTLHTFTHKYIQTALPYIHSKETHTQNAHTFVHRHIYMHIQCLYTDTYSHKLKLDTYT